MIRYKTDQVKEDTFIILNNARSLEVFNAEMLKGVYLGILAKRVYKTIRGAEKSLKNDEVLVWLKSTQKQ